MDAPRFDALTRVLSASGARRTLLGAAAALPVLSSAFGLDLADDVDAKDRRRRRKQRHKRRRRGGKRNGCQRKSRAKICAGRCGTVKNKKSCGKRVDCSVICQAAGSVCCAGACQSQAELNAACPSTNTQGFLTFDNGDMRCATQQDQACICLGGAFRSCAPGTVCKAAGAGILCDFPDSQAPE